MILRTKLVLLLALFLAGAVDCLLALVALWLGWDTGALSGAFFAVFLAVFCVASVGGVTPMVYLDAAQDVELGKVDVEERRAALDRHATPPYATREEPSAREDDEPVVSRQRAAEQHIAHWDVFWLRLARAGDAYGFTNSVLTTDGAATKVMTDDAWKKVMPYAVYSGVLVGGKPGKATKWAGDWTLERFEQEQTWKLLPHPTFEPPEIADGPYNATPQRPATPRATPEKRVITGMRAD